MNTDEIQAKLEQARRERDSAIAQANYLSGYVKAFEDMLAPPAQTAQE
ncbi:MAG: hypothetical protein IPO08_20460 [Xanthomonadales bacterium]|nr:hypothetical protein [Xanthomonadales bacterium]